MKLNRIIGPLLIFIVTSGLGISAVSAEDDATTGIRTMKSVADSEKPRVGMPRGATAGNLPGSGAGSSSYSGGSCCSPPSPFPGLYCCDTQDCGWFDCDATISSRQKNFKR